MGYWQEKLSDYTYRRLPPVYSRDFAYANSGPVELRMARGNIAEASAKTFAELLSGPTVDIVVGPEKRHWELHRNLLCHHSAFFEHEFLGSEVPKAKKGSGEQKLELPDADPVGFELLVRWLYQGKIESVSDMAEEKKYDYSVACHKLYMLCDKFDIPQLKNISIDQYRRGLREAQLVPDAEEINEIYRRSPPGSPFRKLMTQIAARQIMDPDSDKDAETYRKCFEDNSDFAVDMVNAIKSGSGGILFDDPTDGNECEYHDHSGGLNCHVKGKGKGPSSKSSSDKRDAPNRRSPKRKDLRSELQGVEPAAPATNGVTDKRTQRANGLNGTNGANGANGVNGRRAGYQSDSDGGVGRGGGTGTDGKQRRDSKSPGERKPNPPKLRRRSPPASP